MRKIKKQIELIQNGQVLKTWQACDNINYTNGDECTFMSDCKFIVIRHHQNIVIIISDEETIQGQ